MGLNNHFPIHEKMVFKLSNKRSPSEAKLRSLEWAIVTQLNGEKTVGQIGEVLALNPDETNEMFERLLEEGLLELIETPDDNPYIPEEMLEDIEYQLTYHIGPVASILIDDLLEELKRSREKLDRKQLPLFVELLSLEISNVDKREVFQKQMLKKVKELM